MRPRFDGLWRHRAFVKLWAGQTVSLLGSQVTVLALPLTALLSLHANAAQMGLLSACLTAPGLLVGLFAGVWVDRHDRRPILILTNLGRAAVLAFIPAAALLHQLRIELLYGVGFLAGFLSVFFSVAYQSFLPALVSRQQLPEGNSKLQFSQAAARVAGPGLAGALVQLITAPIAIVVDALSFIVAGVSVMLIRIPEPAPRRERRRGVWREIGEGLRLVWTEPLLRPIGAWAGTFNLFGSMLSTVYLLYLTRNLGIRPSLIGLILAVGSCGGVLGALLTGRVTARLGLGRTMLGAAVLSGAANLLLPLASGPLLVAVPLVLTAQLIFSVNALIYTINAASLQQAITPDHLLGRVNATMQFLVAGTLPLGALLGGLLGQTIGIRPTVAVGSLGVLLAAAWLIRSPIRTLQEQPAYTIDADRPAAI